MNPHLGRKEKDANPEFCELPQRNTVTAGDYGTLWATACTTSTRAAKFLAALFWCPGTEYQIGDRGVIGLLYLPFVFSDISLHF